MITTNQELDRVAQRGRSQVFNFFSLDETHFHQADGHGIVTGNINNVRSISPSQSV